MIVHGGTNEHIDQLRTVATRMCSTMSLNKVAHKTKNNETAHSLCNEYKLQYLTRLRVGSRQHSTINILLILHYHN